MCEMSWISAGEDEERSYELAGTDEDTQGVGTDPGTDDEDDDDPSHQGTHEGPGAPGEDTARPQK